MRRRGILFIFIPTEPESGGCLTNIFFGILFFVIFGWFIHEQGDLTPFFNAALGFTGAALVVPTIALLSSLVVGRSKTRTKFSFMESFTLLLILFGWPLILLEVIPIFPPINLEGASLLLFYSIIGGTGFLVWVLAMIIGKKIPTR